MTPEATASRAFKALRSDVEQFDDHPAQGDSGLFSEKVPLALKSYLVNWLRRFMAEHGDVVEAALSAPPSKEALRDVERETLERAAKLFREARVAHHTTRATNGEIPCAQISILADIDADQFRSLLQKEGG